MRKIINLLKTHASHSLIELEVTSSAGQEFDRQGVCPNFHLQKFIQGDLKDFKVLQRLTLDAKAFQISDKKKQLRRLIDLLPPSIVTVWINLQNESEGGDPVDMFLGLAERKEQELPELRSISIEGEFTLPQPLIDRLMEAGIKIRCFREDDSSVDDTD
ncbi:MAG: hypothetical protein L6R41_006520 [Letrouitia leprolyta]|nr:MAG: hypothetical protein L6R41_006520 [Letrouitia leprolyta]